MLSGGQQQRVAVARALANNPKVILADEPTAALDSHRGRQVMELFQRVARDFGAGVIVVTHDHRTLDVFDTIYEMEDGQDATDRSGACPVTGIECGRNYTRNAKACDQPTRSHHSRRNFSVAND